jgi:hypothetical protein
LKAAEKPVAGQMNSRGGPPSELRPTNHRIEAFSDGVFAIVPPMFFLPIIRPPNEAKPQSMEDHALERSCP